MNSSFASRVQRGMEYTSNQPPPTQKADLLNNLRVVTEDMNLASDLSQVWVLQEFQLSNPEQAHLSNKLAFQERSTFIISYRLSSTHHTNCNLVRDRCLLMEKYTDA